MMVGDRRGRDRAYPLLLCLLYVSAAIEGENYVSLSIVVACICLFLMCYQVRGNWGACVW